LHPVWVQIHQPIWAARWSPLANLAVSSSGSPGRPSLPGFAWCAAHYAQRRTASIHSRPAPQMGPCRRSGRGGLAYSSDIPRWWRGFPGSASATPGVTRSYSSATRLNPRHLERDDADAEPRQTALRWDARHGHCLSARLVFGQMRGQRTVAALRKALRFHAEGMVKPCSIVFPGQRCRQLHKLCIGELLA
jgi:hypothetical protein